VGFLKKLFGGGEPHDKDGLYFYIRSDSTGEVIQLRLHRYNDLSLSGDSQGFYVRKTVVGKRSFDRIEAEFNFDKGRNLASCDVTGGELVDRAAYDAYLAEQTEPPAAES
jgi:hypothetical protein